jgi:hypothetical protein
LLLQKHAFLLLNVVLLPLQLASFGFLVFFAPILQKLASVFQEKVILVLPHFPVHHPMKTNLLVIKENANLTILIYSLKKLL